jgi:hypothetical protein
VLVPILSFNRQLKFYSHNSKAKPLATPEREEIHNLISMYSSKSEGPFFVRFVFLFCTCYTAAEELAHWVVISPTYLSRSMLRIAAMSEQNLKAEKPLINKPNLE